MAKNWFSKHRKISILLIIILVVILIFSGFKLYLYVKFLIGNDLVIQLSSDSRDLSLVYGQSKSINFEMSKVTSPLCSTECRYSFSSISNNVTLDNQTFSLGQVLQTKEESFSSNKQGSGQELYRFSLVCKNVKTLWCHTSELPVSRDVLITVEYEPNQQQQELAKNLSDRIYIAYNEARGVNSTLVYLQSKLNEFNQTLLININFTNLINSSREILNNFSIIDSLWQKNDNNAVNETLVQIAGSENKLLYDFGHLNKTIYSEINKYNSLVDVIKAYYRNLSVLSNGEMNESDALALDSLIADFNSKVDSFSKNPNLADKANITSAISSVSLPDLSASNGTFKVKNSPVFNLTQINLTLPSENPINFTLSNPSSECCVYNACKVCGEAENAYPVIFIHGHDFNKDISAEYSLNAFQNLQSRLDSDGFLNAGQLTLYDIDPSTLGLLGLSGVPITVRSTYYYDVLKESSFLYLPVQTKSENIDTYSIRLKTLVDKLKYETGQPKVVIIAHSMGGLVARRYIQLFGNDSVDKLVLINTPNNGIAGNIVSLCSLFGAKAECTDLASGSLFLNKLNNDPSPKVKTYDIIGTGCQMDGGIGDGVVLNENAVLNGSRQYYIDGTCSGVNPLHIDMLDLNKYPQLYQTIKDILQGKDG